MKELPFYIGMLHIEDQWFERELYQLRIIRKLMKEEVDSERLKVLKSIEHVLRATKLYIADE